MSRASDKENRRPRLSDLRDSGNIEQDADVILLIHKPDGQDDGRTLCDTSIICAKQRQRETGDAHVQYHRPTMSYQTKYYEPDTDQEAFAPGPVWPAGKVRLVPAVGGTAERDDGSDQRERDAIKADALEEEALAAKPEQTPVMGNTEP